MEGANGCCFDASLDFGLADSMALAGCFLALLDLFLPVFLDFAVAAGVVLLSRAFPLDLLFGLT